MIRSDQIIDQNGDLIKSKSYSEVGSVFWDRIVKDRKINRSDLDRCVIWMCVVGAC